MRKVSRSVVTSLFLTLLCAAKPAATHAESPCTVPNPAKGEGKFTGEISSVPNSSMQVTYSDQSVLVHYDSSVTVCQGGQPANITLLARGASVSVFGPRRRNGSNVEIDATRIFVAGQPRPATPVSVAKPAQPSPPGNVVKRHLSADGTVEIQYSDGRLRRALPNGTVQIRHADGTSEDQTRDGITFRDRSGKVTSRRLKAQMDVGADDPPDPSADQTLARWLTLRNAELLSALNALEADDPGGPAALQAVLAREGGSNVYAQIRDRTYVLNQLLSP